MPYLIIRLSAYHKRKLKTELQVGREGDRKRDGGRERKSKTQDRIQNNT